MDLNLKCYRQTKILRCNTKIKLTSKRKKELYFLKQNFYIGKKKYFSTLTLLYKFITVVAETINIENNQELLNNYFCILKPFILMLKLLSIVT